MAQPVATWATSLWQKALEWPHPSETPSAVRPAPAAVPSPAPPRLHLKEQFTASDARAERMVRKVQEQMDGLRASVQSVTDARGEMLTVDVDAVAADPAAGAMLPAAVLARALASERAEQKRLRATVARRDKRVKELNTRLRGVEHEKAFLEGRLRTFDETLRALYSNLEDLRQFRDSHTGVNQLATGLHDAEFEPVALDTHRQRFVEASEELHDIAADG